MPKAALTLAAVVAALALTGCGGEKPRFVAFGHSFVRGELPDRAETTPWPELVADRLDRDLVNLGVDGAQSDAILASVEGEGLRADDVVAVEAATNDAIVHGERGIPAYRARLRRMVRALRGDGRRVVVVVDPPVANPAVNRVLARYASATTRVAARLRVPVADPTRGWGPRALASDGLHPSEYGSRVIERAVVRALR